MNSLFLFYRIQCQLIKKLIHSTLPVTVEAPFFTSTGIYKIETSNGLLVLIVCRNLMDH